MEICKIVSKLEGVKHCFGKTIEEQKKNITVKTSEFRIAQVGHRYKGVRMFNKGEIQLPISTWES